MSDFVASVLQHLHSVSPAGGLYATAAQPLPFAPTIAMRSFLCRRPGGNVLIYGTDGLDAEMPAIDDLGGIWRHYLGHHHEAEALAGGAATAPFVHERDAGEVAELVAVGGTFGERHAIGDDFEAVPIPGHTPGATAYLWRGPESRVLFTGDTIFLRDGEWVTALLESSDRAAYVASLELLCELDFDLLAPWISTGSDSGVADTSPADARRRIGALVRQLSGHGA